MSLFSSSRRALGKATRAISLGRLAGLGFVAGMIVLVAYLAATNNWRLAIAVIALPLVFIVIHRYPFITMTVWLVLDPFLLSSTTASERAVYWAIHRALPPLALLAILMSQRLGISKRSLPKAGLAELGMLAYVVMSLLSIFAWNDTPQATAYLFYDRVVSPICLYLVIRFSATMDVDFLRLMPAVLFLGLSQSLIGIVSWLDPKLLPSSWLQLVGLRTTGSLVNTTVYSTSLAFAGLLALHFALNHKSGWVRTLVLGIFFLTLFCVLISFSRASWLGAGVVLIGLMFLYPRFMMRFSVIALIIGMLFGAFIFSQLDWVVQWAGQRLYSQDAQVSAFSRVPVAMAAIRMFEAKPLFGWGYGNFDRFAPMYFVQVEGITTDARLHASHNFFLTLLAEQGLVGFILFLWPLFYWLVRTFRSLRTLPPDGFWSRKLPLILWLILLNEVVLINFSNLRVVFGWGLWWVSLGFIALINSSAVSRENPPLPQT